ncbi:MAG: FlgD immunoglobulin-like domain containing protein, partial [Candidatus Neomarinimicrobiota bacterium]
KNIDKMGQTAHDVDFQIVKPPDAPSVTANGLPNEIVLTWNDHPEYNDDGSPYESVDFLAAAMFGNTVIIDNTIKVVDDSTYNFYGYTVYQYSDATGNNPVKVDSWNIGKNADAVPYSKQRYLHILTNNNPKVDEIGAPLIDNKEYYFGVVAQGYLEFGSPSIITSNVVIQKVRPIGPINGTDLSTVAADTARHISGVSDGKVTIEVIDPSAVTGGAYNVTFNADQTWNLVNVTDGITVLSNQTNQTGDDAYMVVDGILVKVQGPDPGINLKIPGPYGDYPGHMGYTVTNSANRWFSWPVNWGLETMGGAFGNGFSFFGSDVAPDGYVDIEIRFAGVPSWPQPDSTTAALMAVSKAAYPDRWQKAVVYWRPTYAPQPTLGDVPFTVWDTENNRQLKVAFVEEPRAGRDGAANLIWDLGWGDDHVFGALGGREYLFILNETYDEQYTSYLDESLDGTYNNVMYAGGLGMRSAAHPYLQGPLEVQVYASNINTANDVFSFTTTAPSHFDIAKGDVNDDKSVNIADVVTLINHILSIAALSGEQEYAADVNNDLYLNVADVVGIINKTLGRSKSLAKTTTSEAVTLCLPEKAYSTDNIVTLPVTIEPNCTLSGFQIELSYDPDHMRPLSPVFKDNDSKLVSMFRTTESGKVIYVLYDPKGGSVQTSDLPDFRFEMLNAGDDQPPSIGLVNFVVSDESGQSQTLGIGNRTSQVSVLPDKFALHPCFPNPFNAQTNIRYDLPKDGRVTIQLYNLMGQRVRTLIDQTQPAGSYSLVWDSKNDDGVAIASGIYFLRFKAGSFSKLEKVTLLK